MQEERLRRFQDFVRVKSISSEGPSGSYQEAVLMLQGIAQGFGLDTQIITLIPGKPLLLCSWKVNNSLPSILLNGHYDVVPAVEEYWSVPPFAGTRKDGKIYGRGTQDMKCVCMQYLEALGELLKTGFMPKRSIHVLLVPDEEVGGHEGVGEFVKTDLFASLNVGCALDEGLASPKDCFTVFYGERRVWWVSIFSKGNTGHGSRFVEDTAVMKLLKALRKAEAFRTEQKALLGEGGCSHGVAKKLGDVATLNVTVLEAGVAGGKAGGGYAINMIPDKARASMDVRLPPTFSAAKMKELLDEWTAESGLSYEFHNYEEIARVSSTDGGSNPFWREFEACLNRMELTFEKEIFPAATDSRFFRQRDIPAFGFSPIRNTPILLHDHDEFIYEQGYLEGIPIFVELIKSLSGFE